MTISLKDVVMDNLELLDHLNRLISYLEDDLLCMEQCIRGDILISYRQMVREEISNIVNIKNIIYRME